MSGDYLRGLKEALAFCDAHPTAYAFAAAAEIRSTIAAEEDRLKPIRDSAERRGAAQE